MPSIRIKVGAQLDPSAARVLDPIVAAAARARKKIGAEGKAGAEEWVGGYRTAPAHARKAFDETTKAAEKAAKAQAKAAEKGAKEHQRALENLARIRSRYFDQELRDEEKLLRRREASARRMISAAGRTLGGVVRSGLGIAGSVARGAGVDLDIGSLVSRHVQSQKTATDITASGYVEGASGNVGKRQDPAKVLAAAKEAANIAALGEDKALAGIQKFVGKSTDLETGMGIVKDMAVLAKASAGDLEDFMDAAGDVSLKLGDIPNKGEAVVAVMQTMARQGQLGASEMRSFAKNVAPLISTAGMFKGGPKQAMSELGATFQVTKQFGGAKSPAAAAVSVSNFVSDLKSKSGLKALHGIGMKDTDIFANKEKTLLAPLSELMPKILEKTKGDLTKVADAMRGKQSGRVLTAFQKVFADAGGGAAGKAAVGGKFTEFGGAMGQNQINESLARALGTTESKAQLFQNRLQAIADENLPRVLDAMERLAPAATSAAEMLAKLVTFAGENPGTAIATALTASIAKAALGSALEAGLTKALAGAGGLTIGSAVIGIAAATLIYNKVQSEKKGAAENVFEDVGKAAADIEKARAEKKAGGISAATREKLAGERETLTSELALGARGDLTKQRFQSINPFSATTFADVGRQEGAQDPSFRADAAARIKEIDALMGKSADAHAKAAAASEKAAAASEKAAAAWTRVGGFGPGATTGPTPIR